MVSNNCYYQDTREPAGLRAALGWTDAMLEFGDYQVRNGGSNGNGGGNGGVTIERKSLGDFFASVADGRLATQLSAMIASGGAVVLLLEGTWVTHGDFLVVKGRELYWRWRSLQGLLASIQTAGIVLWQSPSLADTPTAIRDIARWYERHDHKTLIPPAPTLDTPTALLAGIPGLGPTTAASLLQHFGSVAAVLTASYEELKAVPGVGPLRAEAIIRLAQSPGRS